MRGTVALSRCKFGVLTLRWDTDAMHIRKIAPVEELQRIAPELKTAGGSFAHWLPHPREVPATERKTLRVTIQRQATAKCLADLFANVGLDSVRPPPPVSGPRNWPDGYVGSVSHTGTSVVAAIAPSDQMTSIGIDLERIDLGGIPALEGVGAIEQPFAVSESDGQIITSSVKEAVYKAVYPALRSRIEFTDVSLRWSKAGTASCRGIARTRGVTVDVRCSIADPSWVVCGALWPKTGM